MPTGTLLLIDDETSLRQLLARVLELEGYTLLTAPTTRDLTTRDLVKRALERGRAMSDAGEVRLRESLCKASYEHAFTAFAELGWIEPAPPEPNAKTSAKGEPAVKWRLAKEHSDAESVRALERMWIELL